MMIDVPTGHVTRAMSPCFVRTAKNACDCELENIKDGERNRENAPVRQSRFHSRDIIIAPDNIIAASRFSQRNDPVPIQTISLSWFTFSRPFLPPVL